MNSVSDRELAGLMADGSWLRRFVATLVPPQDVDDVVQSTWLAALRSGGAVANVRGWLLGAAANLSRLVHRGRARADRALQRLPDHGAQRSAQEHVEALELQRLVSDALLALPEPTRTVLVLRYREGLATPAIAARLELDVATVRQRLHRGRQAVRARFEQHFGTDWRGSSAVLACVRPEVATPLAAAATLGLVAAAGVALLLLVPFGGGDAGRAGAGVLANDSSAASSAPPGSGAGVGAAAGAVAEALALEREPAEQIAPRGTAVSEQDPRAPSGDVTVRGRLVAAEDGTAIAGTVHHGKKVIAVGADGAFAVEIAAGERDRFLMLHAESRCSRYCEPGESSLDLGDVPLQRGALLRGLLLDEAGNPVPGARIGRYSFENVGASGRLSASERTAANGTFTFRHCVPLGPFQFDLKQSGWTLADDTVVVQAPPAANHFVLRAARRPGVFGVCVTADGRPCADVDIEAIAPAAGPLPPRTLGSARTADDGSFELFAVEPSDTAVELRTPLFGTHAIAGATPQVRWGQAGLRLEVAPRVPVRLRVVEIPARTPVARFDVQASWHERNMVTRTCLAQRTQLREDGVVVLAGVAPGMQLGVWPEDPALAPARLVVDESMRGRAEVVVEIVRLRPMAVTLTDANGRPVATECWLLDPCGTQPGAWADDLRGAVQLSGSGPTALRWSHTTTDANGTGTLLAAAPSAVHRLVLAVPRGHRTVWLPFAPAADGTVRAVVPD
jgi:RNA polymerase sigma-70 factor (ECF subfamily)